MGKSRAPRDSGTVQSPPVLVDRAAICGAGRAIKYNIITRIMHTLIIGNGYLCRGAQAAGPPNRYVPKTGSLRNVGKGEFSY